MEFSTMHAMKNCILYLALIISFSCLTKNCAHCAEDRPNILMIMIDDLGWMDLACQGNQLVETPNLDRLAEQGMRFTNAYSAAPVCSPTRAAIMTGLAPARLGITNHLPDREGFTPVNAKLLPADCDRFLPLDSNSIAKRVKDSGYATGFIGKWHLAKQDQTDHFPEHHGFDINIAGCSFGGPPTFFDPYRIPTIENRKVGEYLPDRLADESISFIREQQSDPFMLFLWPYTVHWPMEAPEHLLKKYESRTGRGLNDTRYGAMIEAMDNAIGKILTELDRLDLSENTLVIFTSDNGGFGGVSDCRPLRESKGYLYEGGIRVPLIVRWPAVIKGNTVEDTPVISMDFYPTIAAAAQVKLSDDEVAELDGVDLLPVFRQAGELEQRALFFHYPNYAWHKKNRLGAAIRAGKYKLIHNFDDGSNELYDLADDISEANDIADDNAELTGRLSSRLQSWLKETGAKLPRPVEE